MNRFKKRSCSPIWRKFLSVLFFCGMVILFISGLNSVSRIASGNKEEGLKRAIIQNAVHCYATEGFYPDSISYLEEHYGLTYDKDKYVISYEVIGSNMMPDVAVIPLHPKKGA